MQQEKIQNSRKFKSRWGFILASVGSAVGMANVWGFPNKLGANGGGAFLLIYLCFVFLFSFVGLSAEFAIGRQTKTGALGSYKYVWSTRNKALGKYGNIVAWIPIIGTLCISIGYAVVVAYTLKAFVNSIDGTLAQASPVEWFKSFSESEYSVVIFHIIVVIATLLTLLYGAKSIEKSNKIMMPVFFIIFMLSAVRVAFLPNAIEGYKFMFIPRWEALANPMVWITAMGQAFFSLSISGGAMMVYGAYLDDKEDVVSLALHTAFFDTLAALVASLVIIPACFSYGIDVASGPGLLFVALPTILQDIPFGQIFSIIIYVAMIFAGVSSLQNMFEAVGESLLFKFKKLNRKAVLAIICIICLAIGLNMEAIFDWGPWMDFASIYMIPIGAMIGAISWFWIMDKQKLLSEINKGTKHHKAKLWHSVGCYIYVPITIILCIIAISMKISF